MSQLAPLHYLVGANSDCNRYGIGSFVYRARKPFHPERLYSFFKGKFHLFQPREEPNDEEGEEVEEQRQANSSDEESDKDSDECDSEAETSDLKNVPTAAPASGDSTPPTSVSSGKEDSDAEEAEEESLGAIIENKRADPLLAGIYRLKGFFWLASRPKITGEISAAGAILTVAGFQEWHAERVFGASQPCNELRDPQPIKTLFQEMLKFPSLQPWVQISQQGAKIRDMVAAFLHACYYTPEEIEQWFEVVDDEDQSIEEREEKLEEFLLERFEDLNLEYVYLICKDFQRWGDRRQELVFIGEKLNEPGLTEALDACLLTNDEMKQWEEVMTNEKLDKGAAGMLKRALRKLENAPSDITEEKREKLEDKVAEARFYIAQAKEERLEQIWNDETWAEWVIDEGHDHDHEDGEHHAH